MPERIRLVRVTDAKTGEIIQESSETFHASDWFIPGRGYKLYGRARPKLGVWDGISGLSLQERGVLLTVIGSVDKENRLPNVETLCKLTESRPRQVYRWLNRLHKAGIVGRMGIDWYLSPAVAFAGVYLSPSLYRMFTAQLGGVIPKWARSQYDNDPPP